MSSKTDCLSAHYWDRDDEDFSECSRCGGSGKVTTDDYECYLGAMYKPCPLCLGDDCLGEPPVT